MCSDSGDPESRRFNIWIFCAIPVLAVVLGVLNNLRVYEERRVAWPWEDVAEPVPEKKEKVPDVEPVAAPAAVPAIVTTEDAAQQEVVPEVWTTRFPVALARARAEHRPLLLAGGLQGCGGCMRMERSLEDKIFKAWVKGTGAYLVRFRVNEAATSPDQGAAWTFYKELKLLGELQKPFVGVYWPCPTGEEVRVGFAYARGKMPGGSHPSLTVEYLKSLNLLLADYLTGLGSRPTIDQVLEASVKHISVACDGPGRISMTPADGRLVGGENVRVVVRPDAGFVLEGWRGPDGTMLAHKKNMTLSLPYQVEEGTYTAVLRRR